MAQHHFVVMYDPDKGWSWETDVEEARFEGSIYLPERDEWVNSSYNDEINKIDNEASDQLLTSLRIMNGDN